MANSDTIFVRNFRPNRVVLVHAGLRYTLERRGSREDTVSLPADALNEPIIARWLRAGMIEQISKDDFLNLSARTDAYDPNYRDPNEPPLVSDVRGKAIAMSDERSETPFIIDIPTLDKSQLSPAVEFKTPPEPTSDDLSPQQVSAHDLHKGVTGRPANLGPEDEFADDELVEAVAPKKVATPKRATTPRKRPSTTRKSRKTT